MTNMSTMELRTTVKKYTNPSHKVPLRLRKINEVMIQPIESFIEGTCIGNM